MAANIPVLTYHSNNVAGNEYRSNDHVALAEDLEAITELGWRVIPLGRVVDWLLGDDGPVADGPALALCFDDGSWFDFYDLDHPTCGPQRGFFNILRQFRDGPAGAREPELHASSFVIASPQAREDLDRTSLVGRGWWGDEWWGEAQASGLMSVECHSWDHVHPGVGTVAQQEQRKGDFRAVDTFPDCAAQVEQAAVYIQEHLGGVRPRLFAYPWGQASAYMVSTYFPNYQDQHGFRAAFTGESAPVERGMNRWWLPRFICGRDWDSSAGLAALLSGSR